MLNLEREPLLRDVAFNGGRAAQVWQGELNAAGVGIEVSEVVLDQNPTPTRLRQAWAARRAGQARPVIVFTTAGPDQLFVCGPDGTPPPVATIATEIAERIFAAILAELPGPAARRALDLLGRAQGSGAVPGFRNRNLVSTHYVTQVLRRHMASDWTEAADQGEKSIGQAGEALLHALGYELESTGPKEYRVQDEGAAVAISHVYDDGTSLDRVQLGQAAPPAAIALKRARELGLDHALLVAGPLIRIYSLHAEESLDEGAPSAAYVEFDTSLLPPAWAPLLGALAAPDALRPNGRLERIRAGSGRYAVGLRERFTQRLYEEVVDQLVRGIHDAARKSGVSPLPDEALLYRATLVLLFRLLFLLYAEDRDLLPMGNAEYIANSVTKKVTRAAEMARTGQHFDQVATSTWSGLRQQFEAVYKGNADWGVPPYDGGLFADEDGLDDGLLRQIELPNAVVGPALVALGWDENPEGESGKIDFGDLGVRHLGTIYEGLLSYEVAFAATNLRIDRRAEGEPYVEASPGAVVDVPAGAPHIRSPQGGRKATGSYYTPVFVVDRLVDKALRPAIGEHLAKVGQNLDLPTSLLFDFRVADISMGSGHFLVAALDAITEHYASYLAASPNRALRAELDRARERLNEVGGTYGSPALGDRVGDVDLLRRIVLKRCVYGVDLNPMAVELARLGLWLHSLVPGLPLSYLGANLQHGNSLVGIGAVAPAMGLFALSFEEAAASKAAEVASIDDLELGDIRHGQELERELHAATAGLDDFYDVSTAGPLVDRSFAAVELHAEEIIERRTDSRVKAEVQAAKDAAGKQAALHWRLAFPTVFLRRERPGFDVILGNPPWEEVRVERLEFYSRFMPELTRMRSGVERDRRIAEYEATYQTARERYQDAVLSGLELSRYITANCRFITGGNADLYKAFAERFLELLAIGGRLGVVLPRTTFASEGAEPLRKQLLGVGESMLGALLNSGGWVFADAEPRYTIFLLTHHRQQEIAPTIMVSSVASKRAEFDDLDETAVAWTFDELTLAHPDLTIPLLPSRAAADMYKRISTTVPRLSSAKLGWRIAPWGEFHGTKDRRAGLLRDADTETGWPVYGGSSFDIWRPEAWKDPAGQLQFVADPTAGTAALQAKRERSPVWRSLFRDAVIRDPRTLPVYRPRILFRKVTRATDSRTVRACLVPPRVFSHEAALSVLWPESDAQDVAYLIGMLSSVPLDWFARRRVEVNLSNFIFNSLPVPRPTRDNPFWQRTVAIAGRLAAIDQRYAEFAAACGVEFGPLQADERDALVAELDGVTSHLYGLTRDEVAIVLEDFPQTEAGISAERREAILEHFAKWAS